MAKGRAHVARVVTAVHALELDHLGAQVGEDGPGKGAGQHLAQLQHALNQPAPETIDQHPARDLSTIDGPERQLAQLAQVQPQRLDVDGLVGADALDDQRRRFGLLAPVGEQIGSAQDGLGAREPDLGAELDHQQVHQERQHALVLGRNLRHHPLAGVGTCDAGRRIDVGKRFRSEHQVARDEPHHVVAADALVGLAAFVDAVGQQQATVQMADRHRVDFLRDQPAQIRKRHLRQDPAAGLDLAGDRQPVPEGLPVAGAQQQQMLRHIGHAHPGQQRRVGLEEFAAPGAQRLGPGGQRLRPAERARRHIVAGGIESAMHALSVDDVGRGKDVVAEQFGLAVAELVHEISLT
jgi:hypothetical protein